ncbi:MAG: uracil phosphoribosyltransferase, partial [Treponema sp.]|nr:uracil phosphoribosyltransferase [Treponema sp.]
MNTVILKAEDLDGFLTDSDKAYIARMDKFYREVMTCFSLLSSTQSASARKQEEENLIRHYNEMGDLMQEICKTEP